MIRVYNIQNGRLQQNKSPQLNEISSIERIIWVDLQSPTQQEREFVEKNYKIEFFTSQEVQEIESSSRFIETDETVEINLGFVTADPEMTVQNVTFILKDNILFTYRQSDLKIFAESVRKLKSTSASASRTSPRSRAASSRSCTRPRSRTGSTSRKATTRPRRCDIQS